MKVGVCNLRSVFLRHYICRLLEPKTIKFYWVQHFSIFAENRFCWFYCSNSTQSRWGQMGSNHKLTRKTITHEQDGNAPNGGSYLNRCHRNFRETDLFHSKEMKANEIWQWKVGRNRKVNFGERMSWWWHEWREVYIGDVKRSTNWLDEWAAHLENVALGILTFSSFFSKCGCNNVARPLTSSSSRLLTSFSLAVILTSLTEPVKSKWDESNERF